jgi:hypothetical protein
MKELKIKHEKKTPQCKLPQPQLKMSKPMKDNTILKF